MQIYSKRKFIIGGIEFEKEQAARDWIYDQIGNLLDGGLKNEKNGLLGPGERLAIVNAMTKNANQFTILLAAFAAPVEKGN